MLSRTCWKSDKGSAKQEVYGLGFHRLDDGDGVLLCGRESFPDWSMATVFCSFTGNIKLGSNPTFYRSPSEYFSLLQKEIGGGEGERKSVFELQRANSVHAYVRVT